MKAKLAGLTHKQAEVLAAVERQTARPGQDYKTLWSHDRRAALRLIQGGMLTRVAHPCRETLAVQLTAIGRSRLDSYRAALETEVARIKAAAK